MKVLTQAPFALGFAHWRFEPKQDSLVFALKGTFRLEHGGRARPLDEPDLVTGDIFTGDDPVLGACSYASDVVPFKPKAEALLVGAVHAPSGKAVTQCQARFAVGDTSLSLRVTGDREWLSDTRASEPKAFSELTLGYERAFGGPGWGANPVGKGASKAALPNIEDPSALITRKTDRPPPQASARSRLIGVIVRRSGPR